ncbi:hypothetical protein SLINC_5608 [Streptomyces lincolnensis]|uniref:Uncharacterized protein n=1 Tax=Streptomyces lincolnensis TaxID=1915 RepID=A0A1B1MHG1_STRLN|nr:hypothetical protein [Streptomyces lincolnensis]ANS67832.1 hypothetical protein SLINC_5608 [Streptomyces lincolnensis]AXG53962.1 hypothetical protein SLCG_2807 [Streptomyces lincolnensis]QMV09490.1 hypothetical protein GJU35_30120 [Streptomyces lincolnensis]
MTAPTARNVPALLQRLREESFSGTVRVFGHPGGTIHLRDGLVGAIETPGAPGVTSALLASGRIGDEEWLAACAAEPDADRLGGHLVAAGLIGAAELDVVRTAAVFDGAFAMALSPPGEREVGEREPALVVEQGVEPRRLTEETARRMALLSRLWGPPGELARIRPAAVADAGSGRAHGRLAPRQRDVLAVANGRRTPRDLAFSLGRGLFAVMLDLARLEALGLVRRESGAGAAGRPSTAPRALAPDTSTITASGAAALPKRRPGSGLPGRTPGRVPGQKGRGG